MNRTVQVILLAIAGAFLAWMLFKKNGGSNPQTLQQVHEAPQAGRPPEATFHVLTATAQAPRGLDAEVSSRSGAVSELWLNGAQYRATDESRDVLTRAWEWIQGMTGSPVQHSPRVDHNDRPTHDPRINLRSTTREEFLPLATRLNVQREGTRVTPEFLDYQGTQASPGEVRLTWRDRDVEVVRTVRSIPNQPFALDVRTEVTNRGAPATVDFELPVYQWVTRDEESGGFFRQSWKLTQGVCRYNNDEIFREDRDDLAARTPTATFQRARFAGIGNLYFLSALVAGSGEARPGCRLFALDRPNSDDAVGSVYAASLYWAREPLATGQTRAYQATAYFGPKEAALLRSVDPTLTDAVDLGFFAYIARILVRFLQFLHSLIPNWGVAIILLTVCVRIALFPLLARSTKSLAMMQKLKPELDELNAKFADNPEAKGMATMELYRKHGINPLSGCLPQLAQLPVWWALYTTLQTSVELFHAPFALWVRDLSAPDPYMLLPLVLGATMFLQQKLMPPQAMDPIQAKMLMYGMPVFLTAISLFLPAGLALYMLVNSVLGIIQQKITKAQIDKITGGPGGVGGAGTGGGQGIVVKPATATANLPPGRSGRR